MSKVNLWVRRAIAFVVASFAGNLVVNGLSVGVGFIAAGAVTVLAHLIWWQEALFGIGALLVAASTTSIAARAFMPPHWLLPPTPPPAPPDPAEVERRVAVERRMDEQRESDAVVLSALHDVWAELQGNATKLKDAKARGVYWNTWNDGLSWDEWTKRHGVFSRRAECSEAHARAARARNELERIDKLADDHARGNPSNVGLVQPTDQLDRAIARCDLALATLWKSIEELS